MVLMANTRTRTKSTPINSLPPVERIERRLTGNITTAQLSLDYWRADIVRLETLPTRGPSTDERISVVQRKVRSLENELQQAEEELDTFRALAYGDIEPGTDPLA